MNETIKSIVVALPIAIVSVAIISIATFFLLLAFFLGATVANITAMGIFILSGIAAKTGIRVDSWNWVCAAGIALIIGWIVIFSANIDSL
ncbi:MAG: hypothetical protein ACU843_07545 [Gammaproteobacteria bacterium]